MSENLWISENFEVSWLFASVYVYSKCYFSSPILNSDPPFNKFYSFVISINFTMSSVQKEDQLNIYLSMQQLEEF
jgi:hypothetical protein